MKAKLVSDAPSPALIALRRAARGVLQQAVASNSPIPIWNGKRTVWEVPRKQLQELKDLVSRTADATLDR